jgi:hypothetical protein
MKSLNAPSLRQTTIQIARLGFVSPKGASRPTRQLVKPHGTHVRVLDKYKPSLRPETRVDSGTQRPLPKSVARFADRMECSSGNPSGSAAQAPSWEMPLTNPLDGLAMANSPLKDEWLKIPEKIRKRITAAAVLSPEFSVAIKNKFGRVAILTLFKGRKLPGALYDLYKRMGHLTDAEKTKVDNYIQFDLAAVHSKFRKLLNTLMPAQFEMFTAYAGIDRKKISGSQAPQDQRANDILELYCNSPEEAEKLESAIRKIAPCLLPSS